MFYMWILLLLLGVKLDVATAELKGAVPNSARTASVSCERISDVSQLHYTRPNQKPNGYG